MQLQIILWVNQKSGVQNMHRIKPLHFCANTNSTTLGAHTKQSFNRMAFNDFDFLIKAE